MKPPTGQGPFFRGERLTAAKLNELLAPLRVVAYGHGHGEGIAILGDVPEEMWIRLTSRSSTNYPIKYAWEQVVRTSNSTWDELTRTGNLTNDYAVEVNNNNVTISSTTTYKAWRSETTGEWLFYANGVAPPMPPPANTCDDGICSSPPASVAITFPPVVEFPSVDYPGTYPYYHLSPGYQCYYDMPGDPKDGALRYESVDGWTYHYQFMLKKMYEILNATITAPTQLNSWLETEFDVTGEFADIFPMFGDYALYEGPTLAPDTTTPQKNYDGTFEAELISAKRYVSVRMTHGGACTMRIEAKQRIDLTISTSFSETTYQFGPFGVPIGSTTQNGSGLLGATFLSRRNGCGSDQTGPLYGADEFTYHDADPYEQTISQAVPQTEDGYVRFIDCGVSDVDLDMQPGEFAGLDAWYDANQSVTVVSNQVTAWNSIGNLPLTFSGPAAYKPPYSFANESGAIANQPTVTTAPGGSLAYLSNSTTNAFRNANGATIFAVYRHDAASSSATGDGATFGTTYASLGANITSGAFRQASFAYRPNSTASLSYVNGESLTNGNTYLHIGRVNLVAGNESAMVRINGNQTNGTTPSFNGTFANSTTSALIGFNPVNTYSFNASNQKIAEIICYNRSLEDWETDAVEGWLKRKYDLSY